MNTPKSIAEQIYSVQPMTGEHGRIMKTRIVSEAEYPYGEAIHDFLRGWGVGDGEQWIDFVSFIDQYGSEDIVPENRRRIMQNWYNNLKNPD